MLMASTLLAILFSGLLLAKGALAKESRGLKYLKFALWLRYSFSFLPHVTHVKLAAGLSVNAVAGFLVAVGGLLLLDKKYLLLKMNVPFLFFMFFVAFSSVLNFQLFGLVEFGLRYSYFFMIQGLVFSALCAVPEGLLLRKIWFVFLIPFGSQLVALLLRESKLTNVVLEEWQDIEELGTNYIGTFGHESGFSFIVLTAILIVLLSRLKPRYKNVLFAALMLSLFFCWYRTTIIAAVPLAFAYFLQKVADVTRIKMNKVIIALFCISVPAIGVLTTGAAFEGYFSDFLSFSLVKDPFEYTAAERDILTARVHIWATYIDGFQQLDISQKLMGAGAGSWKGVFPKYAHNVPVSYLYEFGILGLLSFFTYWLYYAYLIVFVVHDRLKIILFGGFLSGSILMLATMPTFQIEGLIYLGMFGGYVLYQARQSSLILAASRRVRMARKFIPIGRTTSINA